MADQDQPRESEEQMLDIPSLVESDTTLTMSADADEANQDTGDTSKASSSTEAKTTETGDEEKEPAPFDLDNFDDAVVSNFEALGLGQERGDLPSDLLELSKEAKAKHQAEMETMGTTESSDTDADKEHVDKILFMAEARIASLDPKDGVAKLITLAKAHAKAMNEDKLKQQDTLETSTTMTFVNEGKSASADMTDEDADDDSSAPELDPVDSLKAILWKMTMNQYQDKMVRLKLSKQVQLKATLTTADTSRAILQETQDIKEKQEILDLQFEAAKKKLPDELVEQIIQNHAKDSARFRNVLPSS